MHEIGLIRRFAAAALITGAAGCSPYLYGTEIKDFRTGVADLRAGAVEAATANTVVWRDFEALSFGPASAASRRAITLSAQCADALAAVSGTLSRTAQPTIACHIASSRPGGRSIELNIYPNEAAFAKAVEILGKIEAYGKALDALTDAKSKADLEAAAKAFCTAATGIASTFGGTPGLVIGPACALASVGLVVAMDHARFRTLKAAVTEFDTRLLEGMRIYLSRQFAEVSRQRLIALEELIRSDINKINEHPRSANSTTARRLFDNVAAARALLRTNPAEAVDAMAAAHKALREALNDSTRQVAAVATSTGEFVAAAAKLRAALSKANAED